MLLRVLPFLVLINLSPTVSAVETIAWLLGNNEISDNLNNQTKISISTDTSRMLIRKLTDFKHTFQIAAPPRQNQLFKQPGTVCNPERIQTPKRINETLFSLPVNLYPSLKLYYPAEHHPLPNELLNQQGQLISLHRLFEYYPNRLLTIVNARSYGSFLDNEINQLKKVNVMKRSGHDQYVAISKMLLLGRMDFALAYPTTYHQLISQAEKHAKVYSLSIAGDKPYILGRVACSKTPLGKKIISRVNEVLTELYTEQAFYQAHEDFISPTDVTELKQHFEQVFIKNVNTHSKH